MSVDTALASLDVKFIGNVGKGLSPVPQLFNHLGCGNGCSEFVVVVRNIVKCGLPDQLLYYGKSSPIKLPEYRLICLF